MNKFIVTFCLMCVSAALAAPATSPETAARRALPALQHEEVHDQFGQYALRYVTAEGTVVSERGRLVPAAGPGAGHVLVYEGETSYLAPDGKRVITRYTAGHDGYRVEGDHLSTPPAPLAQ